MHKDYLCRYVNFLTKKVGISAKWLQKPISRTIYYFDQQPTTIVESGLKKSRLAFSKIFLHYYFFISLQIVPFAKVEIF